MYFTFSESARQDFKELPKTTQKRLQTKLRYWQSAPDPITFGKSLSRHQEASHRFRIGAYRLLVKQNGQELRILRIRHRREVYEH